VQTYELKDDQGRLRAFEVGNIALGRRGVAAVVRSVPGARVLRGPRILSWWREETFCEFEIGRAHFTASELFGDNSRYWIGPLSQGFPEETEVVRSAFAAHSSQRWLMGVRIVALGLVVGGLLLMLLTGRPLGLGVFFTGGITLTLAWAAAVFGFLRRR
jgi:hypothetical protein